MRLLAWWADASDVLAGRWPGAGWRRVGRGGYDRDRVLYARRWCYLLVRFWWWWTVEGGRWTMHRDLIARGLLHGEEGGYYRDFRVCAEPYRPQPYRPRWLSRNGRR